MRGTFSAQLADHRSAHDEREDVKVVPEQTCSGKVCSSVGVECVECDAENETQGMIE